MADLIGQTAGFFGAGTLLLIALLCLQWSWLRSRRRRLLAGHGLRAVSRLGFRNATVRPGRSVLCVALIASATFLIVAVDAFRRHGGLDPYDHGSGTGGYPLMAESLLPLVQDPESEEGRQALNLPGNEASSLADVHFTRFRLRPGDDASCLNLYRPANPRLLGATSDFIRQGRFTFRASMALSEAEAANPWLLLEREEPDGAIPAIADANSMTYALHLGLGDELDLPGSGNPPARLRMVASLGDSIFQGELIISEKNFLRLFPQQEGYRFLLLDLPSGQQEAVSGLLERRLSDFGLDVMATADRLAAFHRVENTWLSTFQALGALGLILGTLGLATVLLRNALERRRELALQQAVGYNRRHLSFMILAENLLLLVVGLLSGTLCALLATAPALAERGGQLPMLSLALVLAAVLGVGVLASLAATDAALRSPLLASLRSE